MKKGKTIKAFFASKDILHCFEVYPNFDEESFNEALDDKSLNSFRLATVTKKGGYQPILETDDLAEVVAAIDDIMNHFD